MAIDCSARLEQAVLQHDKQVEESVVPDEEESKEKDVSGVWEERWVEGEVSGREGVECGRWVGGEVSGRRGWSVGGG